MFVSPRLGSRVFLTVDVFVLFLCRVFRLVSVARRRAHFYPNVVDDFVVVWMVWFLWGCWVVCFSVFVVWGSVGCSLAWGSVGLGVVVAVFG